MAVSGKLFWLSYGGEKEHRGFVLVFAITFEHAVGKARRLGVSPGGEVLGVEIPRNIVEFDTLALMTNRLLTAEDMRAANIDLADMSDLPDEPEQFKRVTGVDLPQVMTEEKEKG
jgi:hypothetical protein